MSILVHVTCCAANFNPVCELCSASSYLTQLFSNNNKRIYVTHNKTHVQIGITAVTKKNYPIFFLPLTLYFFKYNN